MTNSSVLDSQPTDEDDEFVTLPVKNLIQIFENPDNSQSQQRDVHKINTIEELKHGFDTSSSQIEKSLSQWKDQLLDPLCKTIPDIHNLKLSKTINLFEVECIGNDFREQKQYLEAVFLCKLAVETYTRLAEVWGIANSFVHMISIIEEIDTNDDLNEMLLILSQEFGQSTMSLIDKLTAPTDEQGIMQKAKCLFRMAGTDRLLNNYEQAIEKYEQCAAILDDAYVYPEKFQIYGQCYTIRGSLCQLIGRYYEGFNCFKVAIAAKRQATDFSSEAEKAASIRCTEDCLIDIADEIERVELNLANETEID